MSKHYTNTIRVTTLTLLFLLLFGYKNIIAQNKGIQIEISSCIEPEAAITYVEELILNRTIQHLDSTQRHQIYDILDSLQLYSYAIRLIEQDLLCIPPRSPIETLNLRTKKAFLLLNNGQLESSKSLFHNNLKSSENFTNLKTLNLGGITKTFINEANVDSALFYVRKFENAAFELGDSALIAQALKMTGNIFFMKGDYNNSLEYHQRSCPYCDSFNLANTYNEIGRDHFYLGNSDKAFYYLQESLIIKQQLDDKYGYCASLGNMGHAYLKNGENKNAMICFSECLEIATKENFYDLKAWIYKSISDYYNSRNNLKSALEYFIKFHEVSELLLIEKSDARFALENAKSKSQIQQKDIEALKQENIIVRLEKQRYILFSLLFAFLLGLISITLLVLRIKNREKNLQLAAKLKRAEINPHFIFNSLNLVQEKIMEGDIYNSNLYLTKFSKLLRSNLENSYESLISLEKETEFLTNYIELEKMRFRIDLEYEIIYNLDVSASKIYLPSMIIQPFVENAIWHGLTKHKIMHPKLTIRFYSKDLSLYCEIEDNGIGINSNKISTDLNSHKSLGMHITKKRLELLQRISKREFKLSILDKSEISNKTGTVVKIKFPLDER